MSHSPFPAPPDLLTHALRTALHPAMGAADLAAVVAVDSSMADRVLAAVNSPYLAPRSHPVPDLPRAVGHLGLIDGYALLLCLVARTLVSARSVEHFPLDAFWENSLRRGLATRYLAARLGGGDHLEHFALGFCQDLGTLCTAQQYDEMQPAWDFEQPAADRLAHERQYGHGHDQLGLGLLHHWQQPAEFAVPIRFHHDPERAPEPHRTRARIAYAADCVADAFGCQDKAEALDRLVEALEALQLGESEVPALLQSVAAHMTDGARAFAIAIGDQPTYEEIAERACQRRSQVQLKHEQLAMELASTVTERERLRREVEDLRLQLERVSQVDALTGLPNRDAFARRLTRELSQSQVLRMDTGVLLVAADGLGELNQTYGFARTDDLLSRMAAVVERTVREDDEVYRFTGAKLAVLLRGADEGDVARVAHRVRRAVSAKVALGPARGALTVSIGALHLASRDALGAESAILRVLRGLAEARQQGCNRVSWAPHSSACA